MRLHINPELKSEHTPAPSDAAQAVCCVDMDAPMADEAAQAVAEERAPTVEVEVPGVGAWMEPEAVALDEKHDPSPAQGASVVVEVSVEAPAIEEAKPSPPPPSPPPAPATPLTLRAIWSGAAGANRFPAGSAPALAYEVRKQSLTHIPPASLSHPQEGCHTHRSPPSKLRHRVQPRDYPPTRWPGHGNAPFANAHLKGFGGWGFGFHPLRAHAAL